MPNKSPLWKDFEALVERLQRGFHPNAKITRNERLPGKDSGSKREVDICVRYKLGPSDLLMIIDCKKRARAVNVPDMHSFIGLKQDVGAHAGIIVNEKGFSKGAKRLGVRHNVEMFTLTDTQKAGWQCRVHVPVCVEEWLLVPTVLRLIKGDGTPQDIPDDRNVDLIDDKTGKTTTFAALVQQLWKDHPEKKPGHVGYEFPVGNGPGECDQKLQIGFEAKVQRYVRNASLALIGLKNIADGLTYTSEAKIITSDEPARFHGGESVIPKNEKFGFGVVIKTTAVKTVTYSRQNLDLQKNIIQLTFGAKTRPLSFRLP